MLLLCDLGYDADYDAFMHSELWCRVNSPLDKMLSLEYDFISIQFLMVFYTFFYT